MTMGDHLPLRDRAFALLHGTAALRAVLSGSGLPYASPEASATTVPAFGLPERAFALSLCPRELRLALQHALTCAVVFRDQGHPVDAGRSLHRADFLRETLNELLAQLQDLSAQVDSRDRRGGAA